MAAEGSVAPSDAGSDRNRSHIVIAALLFAIAVQAAGFLWFGINHRGWLCSQVAQLAASFIAVACTIRAFRRSSGFARYFWFLFTTALALWEAANFVFLVTTLLPELASNAQSADTSALLAFLYRGYGVPVFLVLLASESDEYDDSLTLLDSAQVSVVILALYLALFCLSLASPVRSALVANAALFSNVENAFLTIAAAFRWRLSRPTAERRLFRGLFLFLLVYLVISGIGNYVSQHLANVLAAGMDLFWTIPYCLAAVIAVRWTMPESAEVSTEAPPSSLGRFLAKNLVWSLAVACVYFLTVALGGWHHIAGRIAVGISLLLYALRLSMTQHRQAQTIEQLTGVRRELSEISRQNTTILESAGEGILGLGADGKHTFVNTTAARMLGCTPAELVGRPAHATWHHTCADGQPFPCNRCAICFTVREGGVHRGQSEVFWRRDGSSFLADYVSSPILEGGQITGAVVVFEDVTKRVRAEEVSHLQAGALDAAANTIVITDTFGNIQWANPAFETLTGYSLSEIAGQNPRVLKSGKQDADFYRDLWDTIHSGNVWHGELENRRKDGSLYVEEMTITPLRSPAGTVTHFIAVKQDITRRKRAEEQLRRSEERFRFAFEQGPLGIVKVGADRRLLKVNRAFCRMLGYREEELLARTVTDITHPEDRDRDRRITERFAKGEITAHKWQKRYLKKDGEPVAVKIAANVVRDESGRPLYVLGTVADVTNEKRAAEALRESERRYRLAITAANDAMWDVDLRNATVHCNTTFSKLFGSPKGNADPWQWWSDRLHPEDRERVIGTFHQVLEGRGTSWACEYRCRRTDGQWADISDHAYIGRDGSGRALRVTRAMRDVTETRLLEAQLRGAQRQEAVGRLAAGVAHDFNNMLGVILGYSDILETQLSPQHPGMMGLSQIKKAGLKAANLTRQLLTFSRQHVALPHVLNLNSLIEDFSKMLGRLIGEDIELIFAAGENLGRIKADPGLLEQVIMNLAVNARDAMPRGGRFSIQTSNVKVDKRCAAEHPPMKCGAYVVLSVTDTGCGIDRETLPQIFEPFFTTKEPGKGTGLGLSIVYGAVKQCGGYIFVKSQPNHGTTFDIFLPVTPEGITAKEVTAPSASMRGSETILVAEDEPALQDMIRIVLTKAGYTVLGARNSADALSLLNSVNGAADLLVTDIVMPGGMGGRQLADAVCAIRPHIRLLFMTGYAAEKLIEPLLTSGHVLITKPFDSDLLLRKVRETLDRDKQARGASGS
jgi:PAS domain S-box-containing protein